MTETLLPGSILNLRAAKAAEAVSGQRSALMALTALENWRRCRYGQPMTYRVVLIETDEGFAVSYPALPGCHSQGATREEALANIREAIQLWQEVAEEDARREPEAEGARVTRELVTV